VSLNGRLKSWRSVPPRTEEEAGELAKSLFSLYTSAAEAVYGGLHGP
jgi:hypothetical protein